MIDPINLNEIEYKGDFITIVKKDEIPVYDKIDYDMSNETEMKRYMKELERTIRTSYEYQTMIRFLKENMNMNQCAIYENVNNTNSPGIRIEVHHSPFSLYDICNIVIQKRLQNYQSLEIEAVAKEVMFLHYNLLVGLIPLSETVHDLVHNSILFIPINKVFGHVKAFYDLYNPYMSVDIKASLNNILEYSKFYSEDNSNMKILNTNYLCLDLNDVYGEPDYIKLTRLMDSQIKYFKENAIPKDRLCVFINKNDQRYLR